MKKTDIENIQFSWIGQGMGYKETRAWEEIEADDVIYVPQYGIEVDKNGKEYAKHYFTKQIFIDLCAESCIGAETLFDMVDWQFPQTLLDELEE